MPHIGTAGRRNAFTLVEVMLAVVVASIIFAAVGFGLTTGFGLVQISREELRANQICLSRMEGIRLCRWDTQLFDTNFVPRTFTDHFYPVGINSETNAYVVYQGTVTLDTNFTLTPNPSYVSNLCKMTVQVTWTAKNNLVQTQTMTTLISKNGIQNYVFSR
jgi:prepilin-type N-terminal cleavage/methylation domain-containing protein